jgi:hypothetical protein
LIDDVSFWMAIKKLPLRNILKKDEVVWGVEMKLYGIKNLSFQGKILMI